MNALRVAGTRLSALFRKDELEQELDDELRFHLMMRAREQAGSGMSTIEASRQARRRFGNVNAIKDACREWSGGGLLEVLLVVGQGARLLGWSLVAGVLCSLAVRPHLRSFGDSSAAGDASLLLVIALIVAALALVACWLPADRASLDPLRALGRG